MKVTNKVNLSFFMKLFFVILFGFGLTSCITGKSVNRKKQRNALRADRDNMKNKLKQYVGWQSDDSKTIELALLTHDLKMSSGNYKSFKGNSEQGITKSQAISMAQTDAYKNYAKDISSILETKTKKLTENIITNEDRKAQEGFNEKVVQNSIVAVNDFLERSYVFVKNTGNSWDAEVMYLYNRNNDLDLINKALKKTLQNTKLTSKEKLWLKKLSQELNK